jgi:hypothetical protein
MPLFEAFAQYFWPKYTENDMSWRLIGVVRESGDARTYLFLPTLGLTRLTEGFIAITLYLPTAVIMTRLRLVNKNVSYAYFRAQASQAALYGPRPRELTLVGTLVAFIAKFRVG